MKLELEQRSRQIKEMEEELDGYAKLGPKATTVDIAMFPFEFILIDEFT